jgi:formylglycine-generating enzyme required for sulfatase activity
MRLIPDDREQAGAIVPGRLGHGLGFDRGPVAVCCVLSFLGLLLAPALFAADGPIVLNINRTTGSNGVAEVSVITSPGTLYRLNESRDLATWKTRQTRFAVGEVLRFALPTDGSASAFFHLEIIPIHPLATMVWIEPGEFTMGSPADEVGRYLDKEEPLTHVILTRGYWMGRYEVTQGEYQDVVGSNPSLFKGNLQRPVEDVTWFNAIDYCTKLTAREREAGNLPEDFEYRLPTESEWEYAARAGTTTRFSYGDDPDYESLGDYAWFQDNSGLRTHPVGQKLPNPWGIYDLHGNVFEWGSDWFGKLPGGSVTDYQGPESGTDRIIRGGYWDSVPAFCRSAMRVHFIPSVRISYLGFRVILAETTGN